MKSVTVNGSALLAARERAGLTQPELAALIGVDRSAVAHWEAGSKSPKPTNFQALCEHLEVTPNSLVVPNDQAA